MKAFHNKDGKPVLMRMVSGIKENKDYLGEIDGLIGDGDHGMNMNKGFSLFQQRFEKETFDLSEGLRELGMILLNEIGGSMGPIYGTVFMAMADEADGKDEITVSDLYQMLDQAKKELEELVGARTGDKTLMHRKRQIFRVVRRRRHPHRQWGRGKIPDLRKGRKLAGGGGAHRTAFGAGRIRRQCGACGSAGA